MTQKLTIFFALLLAGLLIASCAPVNFTTRAKKVPRRYAVNYNVPNVRASITEKNLKAWIVYSDRQGNTTTIRPNGTLPHSELGFMEPLIVIGRRGDFYKLIRYNPEVLDNERLTNRDQAEFCGWLHKDRLLLFNNPLTEVRNGIHLKSLTALRESHPALDAEKHFQMDSLILYATPKLDEPTGARMALNRIVYTFKTTEKDTRVLIAHRSHLSPDEAGSLTVGWVDAALVAPFGQRLTVRRAPLLVNADYPTDRLRQDSLRSAASPVSEFHPVLYADRKDSALVYRTLDAGWVIDQSENRIFNVDGEPITYTESGIIADRLRRINVIFTFDLTENVLLQMPALSNVVQNVLTVFQASPQQFDYHFGAVLGDRTIPFEPDYLLFCDAVIEAGKAAMESGETRTESSLPRAVELAGLMPRATNLIVHIGEKSNTAEYPSRKMSDDFIDFNGRLLGFQVYADNDNVYNNFVLQSTALIETCADTTRVLKRKIIVYPDQLRRWYHFKEDAKNAYSLDFPARSMTQGMIIFPEKGQFAEPELLIGGIDSLVRQVEWDNANLIASMEQAFLQTGSHRSRFDRGFTRRFDIDTTRRIGPALNAAFDATSPRWTGISHRVEMPVDSAHLTDVGLLLTESELGDLTDLFERLASHPLDLKGETNAERRKARRVGRVRRELRNVPADAQLDSIYSTQTDTISEKAYVHTGHVRLHLQKTYRRSLRGVIYEGRRRNLSLAAAQEYITTAPTVTPELNDIRIRDLRRRKIVPDARLDTLVRYFDARKHLIEQHTRPSDELTMPEGEKYFLIPSNALP